MDIRAQSVCPIPIRPASIRTDAYNEVDPRKRPDLLKKLLIISFVAVLAFSFFPAARAAGATTPADSVPYRLRLYHLHTGEHLDVVYRIGDQYLPEGVAALDHFLRDHRTGDEKEYDIREFDLLHDLLAKLGHLDSEIDIVCGYRTPWSNNYLREHSNGVALHSQHMEAKAIDIRIPGIPTAQVRDAALVSKARRRRLLRAIRFCACGRRSGAPLVDDIPINGSSGSLPRHH